MINSKAIKKELLLIIFFLLIFTKATWAAKNEFLTRMDIIIVSNDNTKGTELQYKNIFHTISLDSKTIKLSELDDFDLTNVKLLVLPASVSKNLHSSLEEKILEEVHKGLNVIIEEKSNLIEKFGINFSQEFVWINAILDTNHKNLPIHWPEKIKIEKFNPHNLTIFCMGNEEKVEKKEDETFIFHKYKEEGIPVIVGGSYGEGKFLYMAATLDEVSRHGYTRFPFFHEIIIDYFDCKPKVSRKQLIAYMDWGYHYFENPDELAKKLKNYGITQIHFSGWYPLEETKDFLNRFIDACHSNGIYVCCWLELPMVTEDFWNEHPEWREKTALENDAKIDWRYLMALEIPECMKAVQLEIKKLLNQFDWDGVDLAEIYFESPDLGFDYPDSFTPMSDIVRKEFKAKYGVDPIKIFDPEDKHYKEKDLNAFKNFVQYRTDLCTKLNQEMIMFLKNKENFNKNLDLIVTQIDTFFAEKMEEDIGVDTDALLDLQKEFDFIFQVEDPFPLWDLGPDRYAKIGQSYKEKTKEHRKINVDINIVERTYTQWPNPKQIGLEFLMLLAEASKNFNQVCIYAVNSPYPFDYAYAPYALASSVKMHEKRANFYEFSSSFPFIFHIETKGKNFYLNQNLWPCIKDNGVIIPAGDHTLSFEKNDHNKNKLYITGINGDINNCSYKDNNIFIQYSENKKVFITLNKYPAKIDFNGVVKDLPIFYNDEGFTVICPPGNNTVIFYDEMIKQPTVFIDNKIIDFSTYYIKDGHILYPLDEILYEMKAGYTWNIKEQSLSAEKNGYVLWCQVGNKKARANGNDFLLEVPLVFYNNHVMAPLRFIAESLNYDVYWIPENKVIKIISK
ncbi:hypothetical protein FQB35_11180 [Crassaminicella thermophila]|uniref:Copper amine oxidase-like N-terminal domain-containing protein n=1 Tax=Crassaminicella thermophila TaxID=2599308 RepID=A0A5C0SFA0_CRATE|nr:stalk domain-containing protein [Crassaminicella thermophila]QEK12840.1 hypothetical protein FQB35_11180 [Crassaminicella thermophila]